MWHILRAFLWLRWRVFVNALERTGARDALDRFSVAIDKLGPVLAMALLIPSGAMLFVLGLTAGFGVATGSWDIAMRIVRGVLLAMSVITVVIPLVHPSRDGGGIVRLLLLPIPRVDLYVAQAAGALADPWIVLILPVVIGVAIGLAVGLKLAAAAIALLAGIAFLLIVIGVASLAASAIHLLMRDRRRSDMVMLLLVLVVPAVAILPQVLLRSGHENGRRLSREERRALPPTAAERVVTRSFPYVPSELYVRAVRNGTTSPITGVLPFAGLALIALAAHGAALAAYGRVLDMPASLGARRAGGMGGLWQRTLPGMTAGVSAVALTQVRLALRTPRGRSVMASPLILVVVFAVMLSRRGVVPLPMLSAGSGLGLAAFGGFMSIFATLPLAMNQFAIDRAGFTRQMLSPLGIGELLAGKAVGNLLIAAIPASLAILVSAALFRDGAAPLWLALPLALLASCAIVAPVAASLSAVFPKTVDLSSIGNASNAHQAATLLGLLCFIISALPALGIVMLSTRLLGRPQLAPVLMGGWCLAAVGISWAAFVPVRALVAARAESISQH